MSDHARLSPSGSRKWFACPGSLTLEQFVPNEPNEYSDDGTACHAVLEECLNNDTDAFAVISRWIAVNGSHEPERKIEFTETMAEKTQVVIDYVLALAEDGILSTEEKVDFSEDIAIEDQFGTLDVCVVRPMLKEMCIGDAKFGYKQVPVERNTQLMTYALAKYRQIELIYEIETVRFWIFQPVLRAEPFEWSCTIAELLAFAATLRSKGCSVQLAEREFWDGTPEGQYVSNVDTANAIDMSRLFLTPSERLQEWSRTFLNPNPNDEECAFCRVMAYCPSVQANLQRVVDADFEAVAEEPEAAQTQVVGMVPDMKPVALSTAMAATGLLEDWIKAVRAEVERRLLGGEQVPYFGLELGRQGNRAWRNPEAAEAELKRMRLKKEDMYNFKVISPTQAEKLAKVKKAKRGEPAPEPAVLGPRQWLTLQDMITRADAKPSVKPLSHIVTLYQQPQPDASGMGAEIEPQPEVEEDLS